MLGSLCSISGTKVIVISVITRNNTKTTVTRSSGVTVSLKKERRVISNENNNEIKTIFLTVSWQHLIQNLSISGSIIETKKL